MDEIPTLLHQDSVARGYYIERVSYLMKDEIARLDVVYSISIHDGLPASETRILQLLMSKVEMPRYEFRTTAAAANDDDVAHMGHSLAFPDSFLHHEFHDSG